MTTKILDLIPQNLHEQLFKEVQEVFDGRKEKETEEIIKKKKTEVSETMKDYLKTRKEDQRRNDEYFSEMTKKH